MTPRRRTRAEDEGGGLLHRGINYDVGTNYAPDALSREAWRPDLMRREIRVIRDELRCNAINVYGTDIGRLVECSASALEDGLRVWLQPRLIDANPNETLRHLSEAAREAEGLRKRYPSVRLNVGCELTVFASGMIPGSGYLQRATRLRYLWPLLPWFNRKLNAFLRKAVSVARSHFGGEITYGAGLWEKVDWNVFDIVGLNYYRMPHNRARYVEKLRRFHRYGKPVMIAEFGCCSFEGAEEMGPAAFEIVDRSKPVPELKGSYTRDEGVQADCIADLIEIYEAEDLHGAFVFEFVEPAYPYSEDPRYDLDMASFGVVRAHPDGRWEPKAAFHEIARLYGSSRSV